MSNRRLFLEKPPAKLEAFLVKDGAASVAHKESQATQLIDLTGTEQTSDHNASNTSLLDSNLDPTRPTIASDWRTLHLELAVAADSSTQTSSKPGKLSSSFSHPLVLPPRPKISQPATQLPDAKERNPSEYLGMHPSPHTQAVTSPPEQISLSDYAPWNGKHVEDQMNEQVIKNGYSLKQLVVHETDTAKKTLSPYFKHPASLQSLSNFFAAVLQQRHDKGRVRAPSTFKPPPRVTLTDTKREIWLSDLAAPTVPLRRLSRTIPHGVRGKSLLEHCLAKYVPVLRAIWLAKCVGANELRAFRRKGVNAATVLENEQKWVREWTAVVESFIEEVFRLSHQAGWRQKTSYTLRLASYFLAEGLLDREHFLDWSLRMLESSNTENLPLVLLVVQITQRSFAMSLKHGRKLAAVCLTKLRELLSSPDKDLFRPLIDRLKRLTVGLAFQHPDCLIVRKVWKLCRDTFLSLVLDAEEYLNGARAISDPTLGPTLSSILKRVVSDNDYLARATDKQFPATHIPLLSIIERLDKLETQSSAENIASAFKSIMSEIRHIILIIVQWSISLYRDGFHRVFLAARLIRYYRRSGYDTDGCILSGWGSFDSRKTSDPKNLGRLVAELTRSGDFNGTRFLRWLIAKGGSNDQNAPSALQVLLDMPAFSLQPNVASLRRMLLQGYGTQQSPSNSAVSAKANIIDLTRIASEAIEDEDMKLGHLKLDPSSLSCCDIFEISDYIRGSYPFPSNDTLDSEIPQSYEPSPTKIYKLTTPIIRNIATLLDVTGDTIALASLLPTLVSESDVESLTRLANIIDRNLENLRSAGASDSLGSEVCERYRVLRRTNPPHKELLLCLNSLCSRIQSCTRLIPLVKQELASCDAISGIAAHTPMSDAQFEVSGDTDSELEIVFSGSVIRDSSQMKQVFDTILKRITKLLNSDQNYKTLMGVLFNGKTQDQTAFDDATVHWLHENIVHAHEEVLRDALVVLIDAGCFELDACVAMIEKTCRELESTDPNEAISASFKALSLFCPEDRTPSAQLTTRGNVAIQNLSKNNSNAIIPFLSTCFKASANSKYHSQLHAMTQRNSVLAILRRLIMDDQDTALQLIGCLESSADPATAAIKRSLLSALVDPSRSSGLIEASEDRTIRLLFETVDGLSLPLYRVFLRSTISNKNKSTSTSANLATTCLEVLVNSQERACPFWRRLISSLDEPIAREVYNLAENHLLLDSSRPTVQSEKTSVDPRYLSNIMEATVFSASEESKSDVGRNIESQLSYAISLLGNTSEVWDQAWQHWMQAICHAVLIRGGSCTSTGNSTNVVHALCALLAKDAGRWTAHTLKSIFDAAAYMVEELPAATFQQTRNGLGQLLSWPRISFLFGVQKSTDGWLFATKVPLPLSPPSNQAGQGHESVSQPFPLRRWELLPDLAQNTEANDTALSMRLFDASRIEGSSNGVQ